MCFASQIIMDSMFCAFFSRYVTFNFSVLLWKRKCIQNKTAFREERSNRDRDRQREAERKSGGKKMSNAHK